MKLQHIRAAVEDIELLCGYVHDSSFTPADILMDSENSRFSIQIERIDYDKAEKGKVLFFIPVTRYPWIRSSLVVTGVLDFKQEWIDDTFNEPNDLHNLIDILRSDSDTITIASEGLKLTLTISPSSLILVDDISEPLNKSKVTDFGKGVFIGSEEIEKLRVSN